MAFVAALEESPDGIEIITDNQYVRDTAMYISIGVLVHKGHLKSDKALEQGICYEDWHGNNQADRQAKAGAGNHGYIVRQQKHNGYCVSCSKSAEAHD
eukprot:6045620-Heterocapsa_arctica.AAC.2